MSDDTDLRALMRSQERRTAEQDRHATRARMEEQHLQLEQLGLLAYTPMVGERWWNPGMGIICAVMRVEQRRQCWVTVRVNGEEREFSLPHFQEHFQRM